MSPPQSVGSKPCLKYKHAQLSLAIHLAFNQEDIMMIIDRLLSTYSLAKAGLKVTITAFVIEVQLKVTLTAAICPLHDLVPHQATQRKPKNW